MTIQKGLIGRQDFNSWVGSNPTFNRKTSTGGTVTLSTVGNEVDVAALYCAGTGDYNESAINKAINAVGSNSATLVLAPGNWYLSYDTTIPSNISLKIPRGALVHATILDSNTSGIVTLTVNGFIEAGPYRIFASSLTATVNTYPQNQAWWGNTQREDFSNLFTTNLTYTMAELTDTLISYYDFNGELIHQISSNEILSLNETFSFV